jgi:hypothetical protein
VDLIEKQIITPHPKRAELYVKGIIGIMARIINNGKSNTVNKRNS